MIQPVLHLPLDHELREDFRRLVQALKPIVGEAAKIHASCYFTRLWCDWGRCATEWRYLDMPYAGADHAWAKEPLAHMLEEFCEWKFETGSLIKLAVQSGVILLKQNGDIWGLVLNDFWKFNDHLSPDFKSQQQRGGMAKASKRRQAEAEAMAGQQLAVLEAQGQLKFDQEMKVSEDEQKRAVTFMMRMDRACCVPVRSSSQYSPNLLKQAVIIIRRYTNDQIAIVERYLYKNRGNPEVVKVADRVIAEFDAYFQRAE